MVTNTTSAITQVYYVEDHATLRHMVQAYLRIQSDMELCGTAATGEDALTDPHLDAADIILIDLSLPGISGFDVLSRVQSEHPNVRALVLSGQQETYYAQRAMDAGAMGYILKGKPADIPKAIREVRAGRTFISAQMQ